MNLRTGNEQLKRVSMRIDSLVEDIRTELLARDNTSEELNDRTVRSLLKYIANPLKNITIDGNEMLLDDMLDLYDAVIGELDAIIGEKEYSDGKELSASEVKTFEKARDILQKDREHGIGVIDDVFTELLDDNKTGKLEETYIRRKMQDDEELDKINQAIYGLGKNISKLGANAKLIKELSPELDKYINLEKVSDKIEKIDQRIFKVLDDLKVAEEEDKDTLESMKTALLQDKINLILNSDPKFAEEDYMRQEGESLYDYSERLNLAFNVYVMNNDELLNQKIMAKAKTPIYIAEFDEDNNRYQIEETTVEERYLQGVQDRLTYRDLKRFVKEVKEDADELQMARDIRSDRKAELEDKKAELEEEIRDDIKSSVLSVVPYTENNNGEVLSGFDKWLQRMTFRFKNPKLFFKGKEEVENAMCKAKIDSKAIQVDRKQLLKDVEEKQKTFKDKYRTKTKVKNDIYKAWDDNRVSNTRRDDSSR